MCRLKTGVFKHPRLRSKIEKARAEHNQRFFKINGQVSGGPTLQSLSDCHDLQLIDHAKQPVRVRLVHVCGFSVLIHLAISSLMDEDKFFGCCYKSTELTGGQKLQDEGANLFILAQVH